MLQMKFVFRQQVQNEKLAARMFKMHMTCKYGLVVKPFQVLFYKPGAFCKNLAGNYMDIL